MVNRAFFRGIEIENHYCGLTGTAYMDELTNINLIGISDFFERELRRFTFSLSKNPFKNSFHENFYFMFFSEEEILEYSNYFSKEQQYSLKLFQSELFEEIEEKIVVKICHFLNNYLLKDKTKKWYKNKFNEIPQDFFDGLNIYISKQPLVVDYTGGVTRIKYNIDLDVNFSISGKYSEY